METAKTTPTGRAVTHQRTRLVRELDRLLDTPMTVLAFVWLALLIFDLTRGLTGWLAVLSNVIWAVFIVHFALEFFIAPDKPDYLKHNWLTAVALFLPALRVLRVFRAFRVLRAARAVRGAGLLRVLTSLNRGAGALRRTLSRHGFGYVVALTTLITFGGAAGMFNFENPASLREDGVTNVTGLTSYGESVWWTAMTMTTMGADYFPKTPEGRLLGWLLAAYAFAIWGYITATIASYFIGPAKQEEKPAELAALRAEVAGLRAQLGEVLAAVRNADK
jgi:voltage-gated potassium channel